MSRAKEHHAVRRRQGQEAFSQKQLRHKPCRYKVNGSEGGGQTYRECLDPGSGERSPVEHDKSAQFIHQKRRRGVTREKSDQGEE